MNSKQIILAIIFITSLVACNKDMSDHFAIYPNNPMNDTVWARNQPSNGAIYSIFDSTAPQRFVDSFNISSGDTLRFSKNVEIIFPANAFIAPNGLTLSGNIKIELLMLLSKGDMIKASKTSSNYTSIFESAGSFFIKASKDNQELSLAPYISITIRYLDPDDNPQTALSVFTGKESHQYPNWMYDVDFTWIKAIDGSSINTWYKNGPSPNKGYEIISKKLRWICAGKIIDTSIAKAKISLILPPNYTNKNTVAFAVFEDSKTVVQLNADFFSRSFSAKNFPTQKKMTFITITQIGQSYYWGNRSIDGIGSTGIYTIHPEKKSLAFILDYLNKL